MLKCFRLVVLGLALLALAAAREAPSRTQVTPPPAASADEMVGLWKAKKRFGPRRRRPLIIQKTGVDYIADLAGRNVAVVMDKAELTFVLPDN